MQEALLADRPHAEDEMVKDLRREMRKKNEVPEMNRASTQPIGGTDPANMPLEGVTFKDIAQPGGFRRHHVGLKSEASLVDVLSTSLFSVDPTTQRKNLRIFFPAIKEVDDYDDNDDDKTKPTQVEDPHGVGADASNAAVAFVIAKNFFGSAFMITPKGFEESGLLAGPACLVAVYLMEVRCMLNLIKCRQKMGEGYRYETLGAAVHPSFPKLITGLIMLCQFGFCCIWLVSNSENLGMVLPQWSPTARLWVQLPILMPLVLVRKLKYLAFTNVLGIFFTAVMVIYFFYFMTNHLVTEGAQEVQIVNTKNTDLLLWLGACAYAYEGINIVLPTYESARHKESMPSLLVSITSFNTFVYVAFGCLTYYTFGDGVASLATLNLVPGSFAGKAIPGVSVVIGLVTFPLQAFVVYQTYEPLLTWSSAYRCRKWQKNLCRILGLTFTVAITWLGGDQLQNFLALVGGVCCASLALIFPSILHIKICKPTSSYAAMDWSIFVIGCAILILSTVQAIASWKMPGAGGVAGNMTNGTNTTMLLW